MVQANRLPQVIHLAKNLAVELGPRGIITNAIAPGVYPTKMASPLMELQGGVEALAAETPNKRLGQPEDVAGLANGKQMRSKGTRKVWESKSVRRET